MTVGDRLDLPQGTLDLLILKAISLEPMLTRAGRAQLDAVTEDWRRLTVAVGLVLDLARGGLHAE